VLSEAERRRLAERQSRAADLVVVSPIKDWTRTECSGTGDLLIMEGPGPLCLACADMDHLVYLPSGNAVLTRRAKKASGLSAVVVRFSRSRKRYERQGLMVEEVALRPSRETMPGRRGCPGPTPGARGGAPGRPRCCHPGGDGSRDRAAVPRLPHRARRSDRAPGQRPGKRPDRAQRGGSCSRSTADV
jgi:hypothetical protein